MFDQCEYYMVLWIEICGLSCAIFIKTRRLIIPDLTLTLQLDPLALATYNTQPAQNHALAGQRKIKTLRTCNKLEFLLSLSSALSLLL
jgi:hypothetical protein